MLLNNRYRIIRTLGKGGFGKTYVAEDTHMPSGRNCVIKQLQPARNNPRVEQLIKERFQREAAVLEELGANCDQIPTLYAYFAQQGHFFLVQEWVEGQTLTQWKQQQVTISESRVKEILISLLRVLEYTHQKGIIHRDIKPDNIIIRAADGKPVLIDFGAVKETMGVEEGDRVHSIIVGSPGYMPPEQAAGKPVYASDLYALGLVGIYLLTGKKYKELEIDPQTDEIILPQEFDQVSSSLVDVLTKVVRIKPSDRFSTAFEMLQALNAETINKTHNNKMLLSGLSAVSLLVIGGFFFSKILPPTTQNPNKQPNQIGVKNCPEKPFQNRQQQQLNQPPRCLAEVADVPAGKWLHGGSTAWNNIRQQVNQKITQIFPEFNLIYKEHPTLSPGSGTGIKMLLDGQISFAQSSRPLKDSEYEQANQRGFKLKQVPVAIDGIAVVVNPNLPVSGLSLEQLKGIYTGKITNWNEVGGPNLIITPYSPPIDSGATNFFKTNLIEGEEFGNNVTPIATPTEALQKIGNGNGGIYMATAANLIGQCIVKPLGISKETDGTYVNPYQGELASPEVCLKQPNLPNFEAFQNDEYPLTRRMFVIIKLDGQLDEKAGETYAELLLTDEGQQLIKQAEFIPLRSF